MVLSDVVDEAGGDGSAACTAGRGRANSINIKTCAQVFIARIVNTQRASQVSFLRCAGNSFLYAKYQCSIAVSTNGNNTMHSRNKKIIHGV